MLEPVSSFGRFAAAPFGCLADFGVAEYGRTLQNICFALLCASQLPSEIIRNYYKPSELLAPSSDARSS